MARPRPESIGSSNPALGGVRGHDSQFVRSHDDEIKLPKKQDDDPFAEDRHIMSAEPICDYTWVLERWRPALAVPFTTEWDQGHDDGGFFIEFRVALRMIRGPLVATQRMPVLETKHGKAEYQASLCEAIDAKIAKFAPGMTALETK